MTTKRQKVLWALQELFEELLEAKYGKESKRLLAKIDKRKLIKEAMKQR